MTKVMIFAAGLGTRLKPITDSSPKALLKLKGIPMLEHIILNFKKQGFNDFVINVHHFADQIEAFLKQRNYFQSSIQISDERKLLLETGGGLLQAKKLLIDADTIILHNADIISDINFNELIESHKKNKSIATLAVQERDSSRRLLFDDNNFLCQWKNVTTKETKTARIPIGKLSDWSFSGIHVISKEIFKYIREEGKFSIIDMYLRLAKDHKISAIKTNHRYWFDLGRIETIKEAEKYL